MQSRTFPPEANDRVLLRRSVYAILVAVGVGGMSGRILAVNAVDRMGVENHLVNRDLGDLRRQLADEGASAQQIEARLAEAEPEIRQRRAQQRPFLSGNDRSRWNTVRALVEKGTFAIDEIVVEPGWDTIDMVRHKDTEGVPRLYSSKPPLLSILYAGPYWVVHRATGATLGSYPYEIGRGLLLLFNVLPLMIYFFVLAAIIEEFGVTDWGRIFVMAAAVFATFLTTFAVVLTNHLPAAVCTVITLYAALRIWYDEDRRWSLFLLAGFFAAMTAACELPALSFFALISVGLLIRAPLHTLLAYVPAAVLVVAAFFGTNWLAHDSWRPPYAHRGQGPVLLTTESLWQTPLDDRRLPATFAEELAPHGHTVSDRVEIKVETPGQAWTVYDLQTEEAYPVRRTGARITVHRSDNWYDYQWTRPDGRVVQSYWRNPRGIDAGEKSLPWYAFHVLIGHHGVFSLTPLWLLVIPGVVLLASSPDYRLGALAGLITVISLVCIAFYLSRPEVDRNYSGMSSAFRWVFWMAPLWLVALMPAADWLTCCRTGRFLGYVLLAASVLSASYPTWNPWTHPWITNLARSMDWVSF